MKTKLQQEAAAWMALALSQKTTLKFKVMSNNILIRRLELDREERKIDRMFELLAECMPKGPSRKTPSTACGKELRNA